MKTIYVSKFGDDKFYGKVNELVKVEVKSDESLGLPFLYNTIGCELVDVVEIGHGIDMWVDDEGLLKEEPMPNSIATMFRTMSWMCRKEVVIPAKMPPICGVAVFTGHDDEGHTVGLTDEQVKWIESFTNNK